MRFAAHKTPVGRTLACSARAHAHRTASPRLEKESDIASASAQPRTTEPGRQPSPSLLKPAPVVTAHDLTRQYGNGETAVHALRGVSVEVASGQLTAVMEPSGSGKSTLLFNLLGCLDRPTRGQGYFLGPDDVAQLDDKTRSHENPRLADRVRLSVVQPDRPTDRVGEHRRPPLYYQGKLSNNYLDRLPDWPRDGRTGRPPLAPALSAFRRPAAASGDRPQPCQRSLLSSSPTSRRATSIRSRPGGEILAFLLECGPNKSGKTIIMVTHDAHAAAIADRILFLADGLIVKDLGPSTSHEILETLQEVTTR